MTPKVLTIIVGDRQILVDRKALKGVDLCNLRITDEGYAQVGKKYLHRIITNAPANMQVDHKNKNKLDNRRINLRVCSNSENQMNRGKTKSNTTGYKGVGRKKRGKKFRARISAYKKTYHLGYFEKADKAGAAYRKAAKQYHKEFARINDI